MDLKNLFKKELETTSVTGSIRNSINSQKDGETLHHWGQRVCAIADGSTYALVPYLQRVYSTVYQEQVNNQNKQEEFRKQVQSEIDRHKNEIESLEEQEANKQKGIKELEAAIQEKKDEKNGLISSGENINKMERLKLRIGILILLILTCYLFLFYSSTFYSAFFEDPSNMTDVTRAMFNSGALESAFAQSTFALLFVITAPVIFMGLGFCLHFFTVQKHWSKYLKVTALLCVTFMFDAILAYMIGHQLHQMMITIGAKAIGSTYTISDAIGDVNTWAVIFCGFISYIIWGIVFDMTLTAYENIDENKTKLKAIEENITELTNKKDAIRQEFENIKKQAKDLRNKIISLETKKSHVITELSEIKDAMNQFFSGWIAMCTILDMSEADKQQSQNTFQTTINNLLQEKD